MLAHGHVGNRSKSIAELIRKLVAKRQVNIKWLEGYCPNYRQRMRHYEKGEQGMKLDAFIDIMTALRCEVLVVPLGRDGGWYRLNDFPDNDGMVLQMPEKIKKGRAGRKHE